MKAAHGESSRQFLIDPERLGERKPTLLEASHILFKFPIHQITAKTMFGQTIGVLDKNKA